jgi:hypothetical protein
MEWLVKEVDALAPDLSQGGERDELLIQAIGQTKGLVLEFARLSEAIATMNATEVARAAYKGFDRILERYNAPRGFVGSFRDTDFDFHKFMGHELFTTFFSFLIRENRWELIADLLEEDIYIDNAPGGIPGVVPFGYISKYVELLAYRNNRLNLNRVSLHADILNKRHAQGDLAELVPMGQFMDADLLLFLCKGSSWKPWSLLYIGNHIPRYLAEASRVKYAQQLLRPIGVESIETLRSHLSERLAMPKEFFGRRTFYDPLEYFDLRTIGSR